MFDPPLLLFRDGRILDYDQQKVLVGGNHNLVLLRSDAKKCEIILRVQISDDTASFGGELGNVGGVLVGELVVHSLGWSNLQALAVDDDHTLDSLVRLNPLQGGKENEGKPLDVIQKMLVGGGMWLSGFCEQTQQETP